jgi:hypothetical protein
MGRQNAAKSGAKRGRTFLSVLKVKVLSEIYVE